MAELRDIDWLMSRLGITSRGTVHCWIHRRQIPYVRIAPRSVRFDPVEIERWIESRRVASVATLTERGSLATLPGCENSNP
jgi:predicted DNA-binding transcriptional regulator AlpA